MNEPITVADLEQRCQEAKAAMLAVAEEEHELSAALSAALQRSKEAALAEASARAAWETARRGGPLQPREVAEELRRAGFADPERLFVFERAGYLVWLDYAVWVRPATREGQAMPWVAVRDELLELGYEVQPAHQKRYRLKGERSAEYYQVMEVKRSVLEAHRTVEDDDEAWQEEVDTMAGETPPPPDWRVAPRR